MDDGSAAFSFDILLPLAGSIFKAISIRPRNCDMELSGRGGTLHLSQVDWNVRRYYITAIVPQPIQNMKVTPLCIHMKTAALRY